MRANTYYNISEEEIRTALGKWKQVQPAGVRELCFEFTIRDGVVLRCMTSITSSGSARKKGGDAIRVFAVDTKNNKGYIKTKRVYRTTTWEKNLKRTATQIWEEARARLGQQGR